MNHTTVHKRLPALAQEHCPFGEMKGTVFRFLIVDGTKVHLQGPFGQDLGQAEMRWTLASQKPSGPFEPEGFWINTNGPRFERILKSESITKSSRFSSQTEAPASRKISSEQAWIISVANGMGRGTFPTPSMPMASRRPNSSLCSRR